MQLTLDVPDSAVADYGPTPEGFIQHLRLAAAMKWFEAGLASQGRAAELAGLSREAFIAAAGPFHVAAIQVTSDELVEELERD